MYKYIKSKIYFFNSDKIMIDCLSDSNCRQIHLTFLKHAVLQFFMQFVFVSRFFFSFFFLNDVQGLIPK